MAFLATTGDVPKRVSEKVVFPGSPAVLASRVTATPNEKLNTITITARDANAPRAAELANTFATELIASLDEGLANQRAEQLKQLTDRQQELKGQIAGLDSAVAAQPEDSGVKAQRDASVRESASVLSNIAELNAKGTPVSGLTLLQEAVPVPAPASNSALPESRVPRMMIGAALGLLASLGALLLWDRFDTRVRTKRDTEATLGFEVVAEVPQVRTKRRGSGRKSRNRLFPFDSRSGCADAYRLLRASLVLRRAGGASETGTRRDSDYSGSRPIHDERPDSPGPVEDWKGVVLVTSPGSGDGKSTTAAGLAASFAEIEKTVLVLSWDFHEPAIHSYLGAEEGPGLADALASTNGEVKLRDLVRPTAIGAVGIVTAGTRTEEPRVGLGRGRTVLSQARDLADVVIVDTPPALLGSDALELMATVDAVVLVSRVGRTTTEAAQRASELLIRFAAPVHGIVLVGTRPRRYPKGYRHYRPIS